ncbi:MAG TPA: hypothetical protein VE222_09355 [Nitrospiraceae bacterium]|jgi:hypothetical protein|nr:hypothetical protein [Nitrospiraceae bacterium]
MTQPYRLDAGQIEVVEDRMAEVLRTKTPAQRLAIGFALRRSAERLLRAHLASAHPDWDSQRVVREVAGRLSHGAG